MHIKYLAIFLIFPLYVSAQTDMQIIPGLWVKVKAQLLDGSAIVDRDGCGMDFLKFNFTEDGFVDSSPNVLFDQYKFRYNLLGDSLRIGNTMFHVTRFTPDTLTISSFYVTSEKTQRVNYTFVKVQTMKSPVEATFNETLKDSVYKATQSLFPQHRGFAIDFMSAIHARFELGELKISFVVDKKGRVKNYAVLGGDTISGKLSRSVNNALASLDWKPAQRNNQPVNCLVTANIHFKAQIDGDRLVGVLDVTCPFFAAPSVSQTRCRGT